MAILMIAKHYFNKKFEALRPLIGQGLIRFAEWLVVYRQNITKKIMVWLNQCLIKFNPLYGLIVLGVVGLASAFIFIPQTIDSIKQDEEAKEQAEAYHAPVAVKVTPLDDLPSVDKEEVRQILILKEGMGFDQLLAKVGLSAPNRYQIAKALGEYYSLRRLRTGSEFHLRLSETGAFIDLYFEPDLQTRIFVRYDPEHERYSSEQVDLPLTPFYAYGENEITRSLYVDAKQTGIPDAVIIDIIRLFSFDVDFQREIRPKDRFSVFYQGATAQTGENVSEARQVLMASLTLSGKEYRYYYFDDESGEFTGYYNAEGKTARKGLLRTPVDGARLSSSYGMRKHPILGYNKMHKGTDFAAPTGTPIYAAGDGVVEYAGRNGAYGNYVRIRHNNSYKTAYAHLHKFGRGIKKGVRVDQYQVIGTVGSTGRSTGPHLHYEILIDGRQVNPMKVKMPTAHQLTDGDLKAFRQQMHRIDNKLAQR